METEPTPAPPPKEPASKSRKRKATSGATKEKETKRPRSKASAASPENGKAKDTPAPVPPPKAKTKAPSAAKAKTPPRNGTSKPAARVPNTENTKLLDHLLKRGERPKLFCCLDHDTGDAFGACTFTVAVTEKEARENIDRELRKCKLKASSQHPFTLMRLPVYRECVYFVSTTQSERLIDLIQKEDSLLLERMKPDLVDKLKVYYGLNEKGPIRGGFVAVAETPEKAIRVVMAGSCQGDTSVMDDILGLHTSPDLIEPIEMEPLAMRCGGVFSVNLVKKAVPRGAIGQRCL